ncbi:general stress protein [Planococcus sp. YIM B11945]|uniref:general stress protein n=1 Tax=Planococcus sp. YIM B11945 TaxID=3435410 RepID=UPI003D7D4F3F
MEAENQVIAVVFSEQEALNKIENLKRQGINEGDIHVMAQNKNNFDEIEQATDVDTEKAASAKGAFKGLFTGGGSVKESIKSIGLSDSETDRYTADVARGGILIYVKDNWKGPIDVLEEGGFRDRDGNPVEPSTNEFVNSVDNTYDEQEDRYERGESFQQDPNLIKDQEHLTFSAYDKKDEK